VAKSPASKKQTPSTTTAAKSGSNRGPSGRTPGARPTKAAAGRPAGLFTWIAIGLVVVVVATLVIIKVTGGTTAGGGTSGYTASSPTLVAQVTKINSSVFNTVGVTSTVVPVTPPQILKGQPELFGTSSTGAKLPEVFYLGAEYCPFCAAQRWATIVALSRFGTFKGLGNMESSTLSGEVYPGTPTFTFLKTTFTSKYVVLKTIEELNNVYDSTIGNYSPLQKPTAAEEAIFKKYDTSKYIHGITASQDLSIPFITMGNKFLISGASYTPATLAGLTRSAIAAGLSDPTSPVTAAIIASANYQTAALCTLTNNQPGNVCSSSGVMAAKKVMGLK